MNPSRLFILRPVGTTLLMVALLLIGIVGYQFLPISSLPEVDYPTIQVQTFYPGASPQVMSTTVTAPLEVQLGQIPGLQQMTSQSSSTASIITLQFGLSLNLDVAEQDVQEAINAANSLLPSGLPAPPTYAKVNPADQPILTLAVTSRSMSLTQLQDIANNRLASKISEVAGVGLVAPSGGNVPVAGLALIFGIDRFMSEARAVTNMIGNGLATLVVAKWTGELDVITMRRELGLANAGDFEEIR